MNRKDATGSETKRPGPQSGRERVDRASESGSERPGASSVGADTIRTWTTPGTTPPGTNPDLAGDSMAIDPEELREFMSADGTDAKADPAFKQSLRETLWKLVEDQYGRSDDEPEDH